MPLLHTPRIDIATIALYWHSSPQNNEAQKYARHPETENHGKRAAMVFPHQIFLSENTTARKDQKAYRSLLNLHEYLLSKFRA